MSSQPSPSGGRIYGVGVGPGDPELMTLKAVRVLRQVGVVYVPQARSSAESYAFNVVKELVDPTRQEVVRIAFPTRGETGAGDTWRQATDRVVASVAQGKDVAFITEGDPLLYSTFSHLLEELHKRHPHIPVEVVPGVSSLTAAAASAAIPLASRDQRVAILPAIYGVDDLRDVVASFDTVVLMKVNGILLQAVAELQELEVAHKSVLVKRATTQDEQVIQDPRQLSPKELDYFSLLIITREGSHGRAKR